MARGAARTRPCACRLDHGQRGGCAGRRGGLRSGGACGGWRPIRSPGPLPSAPAAVSSRCSARRLRAPRQRRDRRWSTSRADLRDRRGRRIVPLGPSSIRKLLDTLAAVLDDAIEDGHIDRNPARGKRRCRDASCVQGFREWRGPESNRRHHDFQSCLRLRSAGKRGEARARLACKSRQLTQGRCVALHRACARACVRGVSVVCPGGRRATGPCCRFRAGRSNPGLSRRRSTACGDRSPEYLGTNDTWR